jgi:serine/threonine-protein kinase
VKDAQIPKIGDVVDGKYKVEAKIGTGGMAVVFSARHLKLDERVALKFLDPRLVASTEAKARFAREARTSFSLRSEHVARTLDIGEMPGGTPFIVMELLEGVTLGKWVEDNGLPTIAQALAFTAQMCEGVAEAHAKGIVHRDIKPENLFVTPREGQEPLVRVLDFGISKALLGEREGSLTGTNDLIGTPSYMAPEQFAHARNADARADVWSLGIMLYWLLCGTTPFDAETPMGIMSAILTRQAVGPSAHKPGVPRALDDICLKCVVREREGRYANAQELLRAIQPHMTRMMGGTTQDLKPAPPSFKNGPPSSVTEPRKKLSAPPREAVVDDRSSLEFGPTHVDTGSLSLADLTRPDRQAVVDDRTEVEPRRGSVAFANTPSGGGIEPGTVEELDRPSGTTRLIDPRAMMNAATGSNPALVLPAHTPTGGVPLPQQRSRVPSAPMNAMGGQTVPFGLTTPVGDPSQHQRMSQTPPAGYPQQNPAQNPPQANPWGNMPSSPGFHADAPQKSQADQEKQKMIFAGGAAAVFILFCVCLGLVVRACSSKPTPDPTNNSLQRR